MHVEEILSKIIADVHSVVDLVDELHARGYVDNFILVENKLRSVTTNDDYPLCYFHVDEVYRIDEEVIGMKRYYVYVLHLMINNRKGMFIAHRAVE